MTNKDKINDNSEQNGKTNKDNTKMENINKTQKMPTNIETM